MNAVVEQAPVVGTAPLCAALGLSRATFYRRRERQPVVDTPAAMVVLAAAEGLHKAAPDPDGMAAVGPASAPPPAPKRSPRALSEEERSLVLTTLNEERFCNLAPAEVYATLLDEGEYLCSERTMYRILEANGQVRERRNLLRHPQYTAPELMATKPNQLWSWDISAP